MEVFDFSVSAFGQTTNHEIGLGFSKSNRKSINFKIENLLARVAEETNCNKDSIRFSVLDNYTTFYSKDSKHLPKQIEFDVCGNKITYKHNGLSGAVLYWLLGSWVKVK